MATTLFRVSRPSSDVGDPSVAPAPSGGTYFVGNPGGSASNIKAYLARVNSDGSINWQKEISLADDPSVVCFIASSTTHVVLALRYNDPDTFSPSTSFQLYDASGTLVWHKAYEFSLTNKEALSIAPTGTDVYVIGQVDGTETLLMKLAGSTGNQSWVTNLRGTTESEFVDGSGPLLILSGGDLLLYTRGPAHTGATSSAYIQRCSPSDGSVVWSRSVAWASSLSATGIAIDASDNIYLWGRQFFPGSYAQLPVAKLDSSGTTLWNRQLKVPVALQSRGYDFVWTGRGFAGTDGVLIPTNFQRDGITNVPKRGFVNVAAAGTVGSGVSNLVTINDVVDNGSLLAYSYWGVGQEILLTFADSDVASGSDEMALVVRGGYAAADDASFGPYTRTTYAYDLEAGSATIATATFTRASPITVAAGTARTITSAAGSLATTTYTAAPPSQTGNATGKPSSLVFGTTITPGGVGAWTQSTAFGSSHASVRAQPATGLASTLAFGATSILLKYPATGPLFATAFGLPVPNFNLQYAASALDPETQFGEIWVWTSPAPQPKTATSVAPAIAFGLPVAQPATACAASGFQPTVFGAARVAVRQPATGLSAAPVYGTAVLRSSRAATGFSTTRFGTPQRGVTGQPAGFAANLRFGLPVALYASRPVATGWSSTAFGTPSSTAAVRRTRSARFRTAFGLAQAERTAP